LVVSAKPVQWTEQQRRTLLNLWCRVARADGIVDDAEIERLSQLFYQLAEDVVTAAEVDRWLEEGPPEITELLPAQAQPLFLEHAREIMLADQEIVPMESSLVRELLKSYFRSD
jgi:uncharacterized tellurite resistance protein B-like protein